jgi:hypothetical protein
MSPSQALRATLLWALPLAAAGQTVCSSDNQPQPAAVLERFINADCDSCWRDAATPKARAGELALDWIVPGSKGEDAPLAMGASRDGLMRLRALGRPVPARGDALRRARVQAPVAVRVAQGVPFNDYIGTSIAVGPGRGGRWRAWLLLVEVLPAGAEGSPVPRNLVRNVFELSWEHSRPLEEARAMQIHEGTRPERLRLVALVEDTRGRIRAIARSECPPEAGQR